MSNIVVCVTVMHVSVNDLKKEKILKIKTLMSTRLTATDINL